MTVAHRTAYNGDSLGDCRMCGGDWWDAKDEPPMFKRLWDPADAGELTRLEQSVWGVQCEECGEYYAQINLYYLFDRELGAGGGEQ